MKSSLKFFLTFFFLALFIIACRSTNITILAQREQELRGMRNFRAYLALEYLEYARSLQNKEDWWPAEHFAIKGLRSSENVEVSPELPEKWGVDSAKTQEITAARERLNIVIQSNAKSFLPIQTAHLLMLFDCFVVTSNKPVFESRQLVTCETRFYKLLAEIEQYLIDAQAPRQTTQITELEFEKFNIYFDLASDKLNHDAQIKTKEVTDYLSLLNGNYSLILVGSSDRKGSELYNQNLALRRVEIIKNYLLKNGVAKDTIETRSFGENYPDIVTVDNQSNQSNRHVTIYILKNAKLPLSSIPLPLIETYLLKEKIKKEEIKKITKKN